MSLGFKIYSFLNGRLVGRDPLGNSYYTDKNNTFKRWVFYAKGFGPESLPTYYHNWLHQTSDNSPFLKSHDKEQLESMVKKRVLKHVNTKNKISKGYSAWQPK